MVITKVSFLTFDLNHSKGIVQCNSYQTRGQLTEFPCMVFPIKAVDLRQPIEIRTNKAHLEVGVQPPLSKNECL